MKAVYMLWALLAFSGCASLNTAPREHVREAFSAVKKRDFNGARKAFDVAPGSKFEVFEGGGAAFQSVDGSEIKSLLDSSISFLSTCDDLVAQVKRLNGSDSSESIDDSNHESQTISDLKEAFQNQCELTGNEYYKNELGKVKHYSTVDILAEVMPLKKTFYAEVVKSEQKSRKSEKEMAIAANRRDVKKAAYENSPEFYSRKLCETANRINLAKSVIAREKEAGSISGYVDKNKLYEAGKVIQINQDRIKHFSAEYQTKFGESWRVDECK